MILFILTIAALALAGVPAALFLLNLAYYRVPQDVPNAEGVAVSALIPARNEAPNIGDALASVLANEGIDFEVVVADDHSTDDTAAIVSAFAEKDSRLRCIQPPPLPAGWCGKMHACVSLADAARHAFLLFMDADVRLSRDALRRMVAFMESSGADLASGFPEEETGTLSEALVIPMIHFIALAFLPIPFLRRSTHPAFAAGCGQLLLARRESYEKAGGHGAIRTALLDGMAMARAFRERGLKADLFDAVPLVRCRMYHGFREVWEGMTKNAVEGIAAPSRIAIFTALLLGGQVLPFVTLGACFALGLPQPATALATAAVFLAYLPRLIGVFRFRQPLTGAALHPIGVLLFLSAQWYACVRSLLGKSVIWKGRRYPAASP